MAKKITEQLKMEVPAGAANPAPPIGSTLGQRGLNIAAFCKQFNDMTKDMEKNAPVPTLITIYEDKSFTLETKSSPASWYLKKAAKLDKGGAAPGRERAGRVSMADCRRIAEAKRKDLNTDDMDAAAKIIAGSARAMGLEVQG